jgi:hypothetical protein
MPAPTAPRISDYIAAAATPTTAYAVWTDNRDVNPSLNAMEDASVATDPPALITALARREHLFRQDHQLRKSAGGRAMRGPRSLQEVGSLWTGPSARTFARSSDRSMTRLNGIAVARHV